MTGNLGHTPLRRRARARPTMHEFDSLPGPLRRWLAQAVLPWSLRSARRIYLRELARAGDVACALDRLSRIEAGMLARVGQNGRSFGRVDDSGLQ